MRRGVQAIPQSEQAGLLRRALEQGGKNLREKVLFQLARGEIDTARELVETQSGTACASPLGCSQKRVQAEEAGGGG